MSIPNPFRPVCGSVPALADSITVPARSNLFIGLYGAQEFELEFALAYNNRNVHDFCSGAVTILDYGTNSDRPAWIVYRGYSGEFDGMPLSGNIQMLKVRCLTNKLIVTRNETTKEISVSGDLRGTDLRLAQSPPSALGRDVDIPLVGGKFTVSKIDGTPIHDFRFRADGLGFYDMVERKNYYFNA